MAERVSVIIPCFNVAPWIGAAIASAISQAYDDLEIIAVDDGSTDATAEIVRNEFPSVKLISTANQGASAARNLGTRLATGHFIQYLDADDLLAAGKITTQVRLLNDCEADVAYGAWRIIDAKDETIGGANGKVPMSDPHADLLRNWWPISVYLFRKQIVTAVGDWSAGLPIVHDKRFVQDCALRGARFVHCPGLMAYYRQGTPGSLSSNKVGVARDLHRNVDEIREAWKEQGAITEERRSALVQSFSEVAQRFRGQGQTLDATIKQSLDELEWWKDVELHRRRMEARSAFYAQFVREHSLVFDVGAREGSRAELFLNLGARVVAVEPNPDLVQKLRDKFGDDERVVLVDAALDSHSASEARPIGDDCAKWAKVTTLDQLIARFGTPDFCKLAVDGSELQVLSGLSMAIASLSFGYTRWQLDDALRCVRRLENLGPYRFNFSAKGAAELACSAWATSEQICQILREQVRQEERAYGNLYAMLA